MGEAKCCLRALDHIGSDGGVEHALAYVQAREQLGERTTDSRREQQRVSCCRRQLVEACAHQSFERLWNTERLRRVDLRPQRPRELERVEGVPARHLLHTKEGRARERSCQVCLEKLVDGAEAQRTDVQPFHPIGTDRPLEVRRLRTFARATGEQKEDRPFIQPPQRESKCARRGRIEPLAVVDRENNWPLGSENLERAPDRDTERARIEVFGILLEEECYLECTAPGCRQRRQHALENAFEQVAEAGVGQPPLGFCRPRRQDAEPSCARSLEPGEPERRLPDARLTLEHERQRPFHDTIEKRVYRRELSLPADGLDGHADKCDTSLIPAFRPLRKSSAGN